MRALVVTLWLAGCACAELPPALDAGVEAGRLDAPRTDAPHDAPRRRDAFVPVDAPADAPDAADAPPDALRDVGPGADAGPCTPGSFALEGSPILQGTIYAQWPPIPTVGSWWAEVGDDWFLETMQTDGEGTVRTGPGEGWTSIGAIAHAVSPSGDVLSERWPWEDATTYFSVHRPDGFRRGGPVDVDGDATGLHQLSAATWTGSGYSVLLVEGTLTGFVPRLGVVTTDESLSSVSLAWYPITRPGHPIGAWVDGAWRGVLLSGSGRSGAAWSHFEIGTTGVVETPITTPLSVEASDALAGTPWLWLAIENASHVVDTVARIDLRSRAVDLVPITGALGLPHASVDLAAESDTTLGILAVDADGTDTVVRFLRVMLDGTVESVELARGPELRSPSFFLRRFGAGYLVGYADVVDELLPCAPPP